MISGPVGNVLHVGMQGTALPTTSATQVSQHTWTPSNPATLGTRHSVLISGEGSFQG